MSVADEFKTYQFRVMPFGLTNAPDSFQCAMNSILASFLRKFAMVFIDNILIYNPSWDQHLKHMLAKLREHQFYVKQSKCYFGKTEFSYLGHIPFLNMVWPLTLPKQLQWRISQHQLMSLSSLDFLASQGIIENL
jgi:hypothetical protein